MSHQIRNAATSIMEWFKSTGTGLAASPYVIGQNILDQFGNIIADAVGHSLVTTDIDHYLIHKGVSFLASDTISVLTGATADFVISNTTTTEVHLKDFNFESTAGDAVIIFYKGVTSNEDGTLVGLIDKNFEIANTPVSTIRLNPTGVVLTSATEVLHISLTGGKKSGGTAASGNEEFVLKQNEKCLLRYINSAVGTDTVTYTTTLLDVGAL